MLLAQEIVVSPSSYPTEEIGDNARAFRQLGLGYANLGAFLMANGFAYDSDEGRGAAAAITALMTGRAYAQSAKIAAAIGPYDRYAENREAHNNVMRMHRDASYAVPDSVVPWTRRCSPPRARRGTRPSRSASSTATATRRRRCSRPTGTISFLMDCDTTGIEPDFSLVKYKELVGGGNDDHRQPHGADGAAHARLRRGRRSSRSRPTSPSTARSSARPAWPPSTCRCSTSRSASGRSRTPATSR